MPRFVRQARTRCVPEPRRHEPAAALGGPGEPSASQLPATSRLGERPGNTPARGLVRPSLSFLADDADDLPGAVAPDHARGERVTGFARHPQRDHVLLDADGAPEGAGVDRRLETAAATDSLGVLDE